MKTLAKLYSMRFAVVFSFSEKRSVLVKSLLYFGMSLSGAKNICKNNVFCIKDTAPTFSLVRANIRPTQPTQIVRAAGSPRWQNRGILLPSC